MIEKTVVRSRMLECRKMIPDDHYRQLSIRLQTHFIKSAVYKNAHSIMLYIPIDNEPDTSIIIENAFKDKKTILLPVIKNKDIRAVVYTISTALKKGIYKTKEPVGNDPYPESGIDVVIVPGIAFDINCNRIGYGKGYYDRFLSNLNKHTIKVGLTFNRCIIDEITCEEFDIPVDMIFTEIGIKHRKKE